jgi:drug/metabolite transporter (DMT)-like permease
MLVRAELGATESMANWYLYSVLALLLLGVQRFLNKVAAERDCSSSLTTAVFMGTVTLFSAVTFLLSAETPTNVSSLLVLSLVNSFSFALATISHIEALRHLPSGIVFPLTRLSLVVVVITSVVYFGEQLSSLQWLGILLGLAVAVVLVQDLRTDGGGQGNRRAGLLFVAVCILCGAVAAISSKLAVVSTSKAGFMTLSYLLGTGFSLAISKKWGQAKKLGTSREAVVIGILMGALNFFGFYAFLTALESGPLSAIALITGMHFVIAIILSVMLYREKLTVARSIGIGLTLLAVFFMKQ